MSYVDIDGALVQAYIDMALGLPTKYPNDQFEIPASGDWAIVNLLWAGTAPGSIKEMGFDEHVGILQIDFNTEAGNGRNVLVGYMQAVYDQFVAGKRLTRNSQVVHIDATSRVPLRQVDGWMRATVNVNWTARTTRPGV